MGGGGTAFGDRHGLTERPETGAGAATRPLRRATEGPVEGFSLSRWGWLATGSGLMQSSAPQRPSAHPREHLSPCEHSGAATGREVCKPKVGGSIPSAGTTDLADIAALKIGSFLTSERSQDVRRAIRRYQWLNRLPRQSRQSFPSDRYAQLEQRVLLVPHCNKDLRPLCRRDVSGNRGRHCDRLFFSSFRPGKSTPSSSTAAKKSSLISK